MTDHEKQISGGQNTVIIRGNTVARPTHPWSESTRLLLNQCQQAGLSFVPRYKGTDQSGHQLYEHIDGTVGHYPLEPWMLSNQAVASAGRILKQFQCASRNLVSQLGSQWQFPPMTPMEVICHGDFAPYNCVYRNEEIVGLIDFDCARIGPRIWDLSYALYRFAPFVGLNALDDGFGSIQTRIGRACCFMAGYGDEDETLLSQALQMIPRRLESLIEWMHAEADRGNLNTQQNLKDGHHLLYAADAEQIAKLFS